MGLRRSDRNIMIEDSATAASPAQIIWDSPKRRISTVPLTVSACCGSAQ